MKALATVVLLAGVANAEPSFPSFAPADASPSAEPTSSQQSYRTSVAVVSGVGLAMIATGLATDRSVSNDAPEILLAGGVLTTFLAAPITHGVHAETEHVFASLGMRVGSAIAGGWIATQLPSCEANAIVICDEAILGAVVGVTAASIVDVLFLAKHAESETKPRILPVVTATPSGGQVGVAGSF